MMSFESAQIHKQLEQLLETARGLFGETRGVFSSSPNVIGSAVIGMQPPFIGSVVDEYTKRGGERAEIVCADYWWMMALAYAMADRAGEGQQFVTKAGSLRKGGKLYEWCQKYYKSSM